MKKRICSVLLAIVMCAAALCGCNDKKTASSDIEVSDVNQFPITQEKTELTIFAPKPTMMSDIKTNDFTKWLEEKTNVHIEWQLAQGDTTQAINLKMASGEYPDAFLGCDFSNAQLLSYGENGIFIDLKDLIDGHSYNFKEILNNRPDIEKSITLNDAIYGLPRVNESINTLYAHKMWVYKPWLDKLGLEEPATTEEFYEMLKAFKEKDPNGNGKADEVPLAARGIPANYGIEMFLMNAFQYTSETRLYIEKNKVKFSANTDGYKEGLKYLNKLYSEGLLASDVFTIDRTAITALGESETPVLGAATGLYTGMFCLTTDPERCDEFTPIPPLLGSTGERQTPKANYLTYPGRFCITSSCKYPEVAMKWIDYFYSYEAYLKSSGKDEGLREAKEGELNSEGKQAKYAVDAVEDTTPFGVVQNQNWAGNSFGVSYMDTERYGYMAVDEQSKNRPSIDKLTHEKYEPYAKDLSWSEQTVMKDTEKEIRYNELYTSIRDEVDKWFVDFVMGRKDIDKYWKQYKDRLTELGLKEMLELCQDAIS